MPSTQEDADLEAKARAARPEMPADLPTPAPLPGTENMPNTTAASSSNMTTTPPALVPRDSGATVLSQEEIDGLIEQTILFYSSLFTEAYGDDFVQFQFVCKFHYS